MSDGTPAIAYDKPVPREPKSPAHTARVQAQNRRREYLQRHPSYYESLDHEMADPVLYERLVKRFQSASERTAEGKAKGYGRMLEASLLRGEDKLANLASAKETASYTYSSRAGNGTGNSSPGIGANAWDAPAADKEHGAELWRSFLEDRFVQGRDGEFDYEAKVDGNEELDVWEREGREERWYDEEEPSWVDEDGDEEVGGRGEKRKGETGVQDY